MIATPHGFVRAKHVGSFLHVTFPSKKECQDYVRARSTPKRDSGGHPVERKDGEDDLFLMVSYSMAEQLDGTWKLVF
jgi:hypothetical protein